MSVDGPMELLAEAARRYGGVDPDNDEAVVDFLEKSGEKIPDGEARKIVAALAQRDAPRALRTEGASEAVASELQFPKLDDARREAKFHEQLRQIEAERNRPMGDLARIQQLYLTSTLISRIALTIVLGVVALSMPGGFGATSASARMVQIALAVAAALSALSAIDKLSFGVIQRLVSRRSPRSEVRTRT